MRVNVNKLAASAIGIIVICGSIIPAFASDTVQNLNTTTNAKTQVNGKPLFTLDDAMKAAISNSDTLALDNKKISYQDKINDVTEESDDFSQVNNDKEDLDEDTADITLEQLKQQRDFDEDKLIQKTTKAYNDIVTSQMKIDKAAKDLEVKNKQLNDSKLKQSLGLITRNDLKSTELQIESLQNTQKSSKNALEDAQYSFKVLTGKDIAKYSLEQDIKYDEFKIDGSIDEYFDNAINKYLKYSEQLIKLNKDYYNDDDNEVSEDDVKSAKEDSENAVKPNRDDYSTYEDYIKDKDKYDSTISGYTAKLAQRLTYLNTKLGIYEKETSLNESKKQYKDQIKTLYTNLLATEDIISTLKKNIYLDNTQLSNAKLNFDLGLMTKSDYDTLVINSRDLEFQLRDAIYNYNTLKEEIQKPWIPFSY